LRECPPERRPCFIGPFNVETAKFEATSGADDDDWRHCAEYAKIRDEGLRGASKMMDDNLTVFGKIVETVRPLLHHAAALGEVLRVVVGGADFVASGEILIERPKPDRRTRHVTVGRLENHPEARPPTWLFDEGLRLSDEVYCVCVSDPNKAEA
jgi:hypothetical protein